MSADLNRRLLTAGILIAIILTLIFFAKVSCTGHWGLIVLAVIINLACAHEFSTLCSRNYGSVSRAVIYFVLALAPSAFTAFKVYNKEICSLEQTAIKELLLSVQSFTILIMLFGLAYAIWQGRDNLEKGFIIAGEVFMGLLLIALGSIGLLAIALHPASHYLLLWLIATVALNDSAAYFIGSKYQSAKLFPSISPNKSIFGFCAGLIVGTITGILLGFLFDLADAVHSLFTLSLVSLTCILCAQTGDLCKSALKRMHGVKDSGKIFPGHGGVLDRLDGMLAGAIALSFFIYK